MNKHKQDRFNSHQAPGIDDFELLKPISKGAFGHVYLVRRRGTEKLYAMKAMKKSDVLNKNMIEQVVAERDALAVTKSPFVVQLFYSFQTKNNIFLVMEYLIGGDCKSLLHNLGYFDQEMARTYIAEVTLALEYLHRHGIVHRDIKPDNMLISNQGHVKLTDFGLTRLTRERMPISRDKTLINRFNERDGKPNFLDLMETPGTLKTMTPSQRSAFWRTPGQIVSLTSKFSFSVPKKTPTASALRLHAVNKAAEASSMSVLNAKSAYEFTSPADRSSRCCSAVRANRPRYPSLSTPKTTNTMRKVNDTASDPDNDPSILAKQIKFASPSNEKDTSDESDISTHAVPILRCTGLTTEFDNLLMKNDLRSCMKRANENVEIGTTKRVRLSSPIRFQCNSSSDDEVTINPRLISNSDGIVNRTLNHTSDGFISRMDDHLRKGSPHDLNRSGSPFSSPNGLSYGYGACNISGVTTITETTRMSIPHSDADDLSLPQQDESDIKESSFGEHNEQKPPDIAFLSPVGTKLTSRVGFGRSDSVTSQEVPSFRFDESIGGLSPMEVQEINTIRNTASSPLETISCESRIGGFPTNISNLATELQINSKSDATSNKQESRDEIEPEKSEHPVNELSQSLVETDERIDSSVSFELKEDDSYNEVEINETNQKTSNDLPDVLDRKLVAVKEAEGGNVVDHIMQTPAPASRRCSSSMDTSDVMVHNSFRTPAHPLTSKIDSQKRTPYRTPKSCRRGAAAKTGGCIIGTPDYLAPEILLDQEHGPSVDWWSLGVCLYEFLTGVPPFNDETPELVFQHILNRDLVWPEGEEALSELAVDFINRLLVRKISDRLGAKEIRIHPFFAEIDWEHLHKAATPFVPAPDDACDTTYFEARNNVQNLKISAFRM